MPKRNKQRSQSRRGNANRSNTSRMTTLAGNASGNIRESVIENGCGLFSFAIANPDTGGALALNLSTLSSNIPRFAELMESYQFYRFKKIQIKMLPQSINADSAGTVTLALSYSPGDPTGSSSQTTASTLSFPNSIFMNSKITMPQILSLNTSILLRDGQSKWYRTQPSAAVESWEENQGEFLFNLSAAATGTQTFYGHMFYVLELAAQVAPNNIPMEPPITDHFVSFISKRLEKLGHLKIDKRGSNLSDDSSG